MKIERIVICDDVLRIGKDGSAEVAPMERVCGDLVQGSLERALQGVEVVSDKEMAFGQDFAETFYAVAGLAPDGAEWGKIAAREPAPRQIAMVKSLFEDSLVIGLELPQILKTALQLADVSWLDFVPHPARYVNEAAMGVAGNIRGLDLGKWTFTEAEMRKQAALRGTGAARRRNAVASSDDNAVFICQPAASPRRWLNGKFLEIEDFQEEIFEIIRKHDHILVLRDGYEEPEEIDLFFTQLCPKTHLHPGGFYELLDRPDVTAIYSLNSDKSLAAPYFGKHGHALSQGAFHFDARKLTPEAYIPVLNPLYEASFWGQLMYPLGVEPDCAKWPETGAAGIARPHRPQVIL